METPVQENIDAEPTSTNGNVIFAGNSFSLSPQVSTSRVYVGNLSFKTSWQTLKDHFKSCGNVVFADVFTNGGWSKVSTD
jgi:RNA recognition motif-containing protein